MQHVTDH